MGWGLTRSPAMLFSLLSLYFYLGMLVGHSEHGDRYRRAVAGEILPFHLGWFTGHGRWVLLWIFCGNNRRNFISSIFIVLGVLVLQAHTG